MLRGGLSMRSLNPLPTSALGVGCSVFDVCLVKPPCLILRTQSSIAFRDASELEPRHGESVPLADRVKSKLGAGSSFSVVTIQRFNESTRRSAGAALLFIVNGLIVELLPVDRATHRDGARFAIRRNGTLAG